MECRRHSWSDRSCSLRCLHCKQRLPIAAQLSRLSKKRLHFSQWSYLPRYSRRSTVWRRWHCECVSVLNLIIIIIVKKRNGCYFGNSILIPMCFFEFEFLCFLFKMLFILKNDCFLSKWFERLNIIIYYYYYYCCCCCY